MTVKSDGTVLVTVPFWASYEKGRQFANDNKEWIFKKIKKIKERTRKSLLEQGTKKDYQALKEDARELACSLIKKYNAFYGFEFKKIFIRDQKTRWGSCSDGKNLNFNYRIVKLKQEQAEYLVVHELCHLKEMNHSSKFWALVAQTIPDYKKVSRELRRL